MIDGEEEETEVLETPEVEEEAHEEAENDNTEGEILTVQIGDEAPEEDDTAKAPEWVKDLRRKSRDDAKRIRDLEAALAEREKKPDAIGPKPTLESCDYDESRFETELDNWKAAKSNADAAEQAARDEQAANEERWQTKLATFQEKKKALKVPDIEDAEDFVRDTFSVVQQGILIEGAENPALLGYALFKNPAKAKELAKITNPVEYSFALAKTEAQLKVGTKNAPPPPEKGFSGRGGTNAVVDNTLERLREKAARTGDYSEVVKYKREQSKKRAA
jgi:hypothetical protein